jgi:hypothetical protein
LGAAALVCWLLRQAQLAACQVSQHPRQAQGAAAAVVAAAAAVDCDLQEDKVKLGVWNLGKAVVAYRLRGHRAQNCNGMAS